MRRILAALVLALGFFSLAAPAMAQTLCGPTPALPDTERRTEYAGIVSQTGPFNVGFQLYGDGTDYGNWVSVWVNGVALIPVTDFIVTSPTGPLATICRPITDAQVTFTVARTGTIEIEGSRRPRRTSQASETVGITARTFNQVISDLTAELRERWDRQSRLVRTPPGESLSPLPPLASRQNGGTGTFLIFDGITGDVKLSNGNGIASVLPSQLPAGVDANVLNSQTTTYPIATTDCGKTVQLTTGFFTATVPAVTGFLPTCKVTLVNGDTGRGKTIAGLTNLTAASPCSQSGVGAGATSCILWPQQSITIEIVNGAWVVLNPAPRWQLSSAITFNVDPVNGLDTSDGLGTGAGAFQHIQNCVDAIANNIYFLSGGSAYCQLVNGTYSEAVTFKPITGNINRESNVARVVGNVVTPFNVIMKGASTGSIFRVVTTNMPWLVTGFTASPTATTDNVFTLDWGGKIDIGIFALSTAVADVINARYPDSKAEILRGAILSMSANFNTFCNVAQGGLVLSQGGGTITGSFPGTTSIGNVFANVADTLSVCDVGTIAWTGTISGTKYLNLGGNFGGANPDNYPGSVAGVSVGQFYKGTQWGLPYFNSAPNAQGISQMLSTAALGNAQICIGQTGAACIPTALSGACTMTAAGVMSCSTSLTVGTSPITGGANARVLYDQAGVLGEYTTTGSSTTVVMSTGPTIANATVTGSFTATGLVTNAALANPATTVAGQTCTLGSTCGLSSVTNSLGADVNLGTIGTYFDGPSVAQGATGTWFASGTVTLTDTAVGTVGFFCKLWDGTNIIATAVANGQAANNLTSMSLSGVSVASPPGNIRISCQDGTATTGKIKFNVGGSSKDSTVTAIRIN